MYLPRLNGNFLFPWLWENKLGGFLQIYGKSGFLGILGTAGNPWKEERGGKEEVFLSARSLERPKRRVVVTLDRRARVWFMMGTFGPLG